MTNEPTTRDSPWLMRTYAGHSSAAASNALFRANLATGQTGLSIAFDLPTQTGYDSDHPLARGEVGRVGVPVGHLGDMTTLFEGLPLERMNTSMTINATAPWLLALYVALADSRGTPRAALAGTTQNDIIKEYLSRGTHIFPPEPSLGLTVDTIAFALRAVPKWNPVNVCSYHLQEAGATPVQEVAFALATAIAILDRVKAGGQVTAEELSAVVGRISFFVNAGVRFVTELCKLRAFAELWDEITTSRYGVTDPKHRLFRYGVQVNSLGLTEQQPENNVYRILLEVLAVVLSKRARARAVQLPAWNEALGLPSPWDQQWSLRLQQIVAFESDLLDHEDLFDGSHVVAAKVTELKLAAMAELDRIEGLGGAVAAVESGAMKGALVAANARRMAAIEAGEQTVVGVNRYTETAPSPLASQAGGGIVTIDQHAERDQIARLEAWRRQRDGARVADSLARLRDAATAGRNVMEPSIACAHAGVTTGEWAETLRKIHGEYRAPTGVGGIAAGEGERIRKVRASVEAASLRLGRRLKLLVGKPGLDGHSNGAEQVALRARDCGFEVVYQGIRLTPAQIAAAALEESVHVVGLSILSGAHGPLVAEVLERMRAQGQGDIPVVVGGIIPEADRRALTAAGVARIYTPRDYDLTAIVEDVVGLLVGAGANA
ncbi:MAG: protein meaA [Alphaproteobacteria bacterium]|nr:protein meaA [Alphaproteobacteria bacterium]